MAPLPGDDYGTLFALPAVDDPAETEVGVIILGLSAERLLAGLGVAGIAREPTGATLTDLLGIAAIDLQARSPDKTSEAVTQDALFGAAE